MEVHKAGDTFGRHQSWVESANDTLWANLDLNQLRNKFACRCFLISTAVFTKQVINNRIGKPPGCIVKSPKDIRKRGNQ